MTEQPDPRRSPPRPNPAVPKPPSREDVERISEAQEMITDEWTGDGGQPAQRNQSPVPPESPKDHKT